MHTLEAMLFHFFHFIPDHRFSVNPSSIKVSCHCCTKIYFKKTPQKEHFSPPSFAYDGLKWFYRVYLLGMWEIFQPLNSRIQESSKGSELRLEQQKSVLTSIKAAILNGILAVQSIRLGCCLVPDFCLQTF